ncbi:hypothetical protein ABK040_012193, partial [Willaertia magna]
MSSNQKDHISDGKENQQHESDTALKMRDALLNKMKQQINYSIQLNKPKPKFLQKSLFDIKPQDLPKEGAIPGSLYGVIQLPSFAQQEDHLPTEQETTKEEETIPKIIDSSKTPFNSEKYTNIGITFLGSSGIAVNDNNYKQIRKIYVGGIPEGTTEKELITFFTFHLKKIGFDYSNRNNAQPVNSFELINVHALQNVNQQYNIQQSNYFSLENVIHCSMHKGYAFIDFRTPQEASYCVNVLDGISFKGISNLKMKRPKDYIDPNFMAMNIYDFILNEKLLNQLSNKTEDNTSLQHYHVNKLYFVKVDNIIIEVIPSRGGYLIDSPNKLFIGNLKFKKLNLKHLILYFMRKFKDISMLKSIHLPKLEENLLNEKENEGYLFCEFYGNVEKIIGILNQLKVIDMLKEMMELNCFNEEDDDDLEVLDEIQQFIKQIDNKEDKSIKEMLEKIIVQRVPCESKLEWNDSDKLNDIQQSYRQEYNSISSDKLMINNLLDFKIPLDLTLQKLFTEKNNFDFEPSNQLILYNCFPL